MILRDCNIVQHLVERSLYGFPFPFGLSPFVPAVSQPYEKLLFNFRSASFTDYQFADQTNLRLDTINQPMYCCKFGKDTNTEHLVAFGGEDGNIFIVDSTQSSFTSTIRAAQAADVHSDAVIDVTWVPQTDELVSCSGDRSVVLWKLAPDRLTPTIKLIGHNRTVKTVQVNSYDPSVVASGSRDCNIVVWDRRCGPHNRADQISAAHPSSSMLAGADGRVTRTPGRSGRSQKIPPNATPSNAVASLIFYEQHTLVSAGSTDGLIKLWDLRKTYSTMRRAPVPVHTLSQPQSAHLRGFGWACAPERSHYLYALGMDCKIYAYHLAGPTAEPVSSYTGCRNTSHYVRIAVSPCGRFLVSGSDDGRALIWLTSRPGPPVAQLTGHAGDVSAVDWGHHRADKIATCGDDCVQKIFFMKDAFNIEESLFHGKAEPADETVLARCATTTTVRHSGRRLPRFGGLNTFNTCNETGRFPPVPKTPSSRQTPLTAMSTPSRASLSSNAHLATPGRYFNTPGKNVFSPAPSTPRSSQMNHTGVPAILSTPCQSERVPNSPFPSASGGGASGSNAHPQTPSSLDKSMTLLQWLSTAKKTPQPTTAIATPKQNNQNQSSCSSASKRAGIKRKLTDVLEIDEDEENVLADGSGALKKKPTSPSEDVLCDINNHNPGSSVAKMLVYSKSSESQKNSLAAKLETISEIGDSVQPFESSMMDTLRNDSLRNSFNENKSTSNAGVNQNVKVLNDQESSGIKSNLPSIAFTPVKEIARHSPTKSRFESPTANLPNFVEDGTSPRPVPVIREKPVQVNWLNAIAGQRKLKFGTTPDGKAKVTPSRKPTSATKRGTKPGVNRKKKYLKIVPLSNTPSDGQGSAKKTTQTRLAFN